MKGSDSFLAQVVLLPKVQFGNGASKAEIAKAERSLGVKFPRSYVRFLREVGWCEADGFTVLGLGKRIPALANMPKVARLERTGWRELAGTEQRLVPVVPDGRGGHYCLDTAHMSRGECPVVLVDHEFLAPGYRPERAGRTFETFFRRNAPKPKRVRPKSESIERSIRAIGRQAKKAGIVGQQLWKRGTSNASINAAQSTLGIEFPLPIRQLFRETDGFEHAGGWRHFGVGRGLPEDLSCIAWYQRLQDKSSKNTTLLPLGQTWNGVLCCMECAAKEHPIFAFDSKRLTRLRVRAPLPLATWARRMGEGSLDPWEEDD